MDRIRNYLEISGYIGFIKIEDLFKIDLEGIKGITFSELCKKSKFYILIEGYIDTYYPDKLGKNHIIKRISSKDYQIGGLQLYFGREYDNLNDYYLMFSKNSLLYGIDLDRMNDLMENKDFFKLLLKKNIEFLFNVIQENYFKDVFNLEEYIAYILYHHSENNQYVVENYFKFSSLTKCNRSTLYKVLGALERNDIIQKKGKIINIKSMEKLKSIFEEKNF